MAAVQFGTSGKTYRLGARNIARVGANVYFCVLNVTDGKVEMWKSTGGAAPVLMGVGQTAYASAKNCACFIDSTGTIQVVYYYDATHLYYNTFATSSDTWGTGASAYTVTTGSNYYCAIAGDASDKPHIAFNNYVSSISVLQYGNKTGASWSTAVTVLASKAATVPDIAIDTTSGHTARYNYPQIVFINTTNNTLEAALGNANNATAFTVINPSGLYAGYSVSIVIDSNGGTTVFTYDPIIGDVEASNISVSSACGTAGSWANEANITGDQTNAVNSLSAAASGTSRYCFVYDVVIEISYVGSTSYGSWGAETQLEIPASIDVVSVGWAYANTPSYSTYGIDYLFTAGAGINNLYYGNLPLGAAPASASMGFW